jgi:hypothetical protein
MHRKETLKKKFHNEKRQAVFYSLFYFIHVISSGFRKYAASILLISIESALTLLKMCLNSLQYRNSLLKRHNRSGGISFD